MTPAQEAKLDEILSMLRSLAKSGASGNAGKVADDKLFYGPYGNPDIRIEPKEWTGPSMKGQLFSEAPPEWLDLAAEMFERFGAKAEKEGRISEKTGKPNAWMDFQKAALARRWAQEKRNGTAPKPKARDSFDFDGTADPF